MNISPSLTTIVFLKDYSLYIENCLKASSHINCENFFAFSLQLSGNKKLKLKGIRCLVKYQFYIKHVILLACMSEKPAQTETTAQLRQPNYPTKQSGAK